MNDKKTSIIAILEILKKYSDENHALSVSKIISILKENYNISIDRRTVYSNINMLIDYGYDISTFSDNKKGYYLNERDLEKSEVFLLCNAIHASNFIPINNSKQLINKLLDTQSKYVSNDFRNTVFVENNEKKENKDFFWNIEILSDCIKNKKNISFDYTKYNINKEIVKRRKEPYVVSPYYLVYAQDKTYLIGKSVNHDNLLHFRVDRMKSVRVSSISSYCKLKNNEDPYQYAKNKLYMYSGKNLDIVIRCDMSILDDIIDRFGKEISISAENDNEFIATVQSSEEGMIYYALQYIGHLEILRPVALRNKVKDYLKEGLNKYL